MTDQTDFELLRTYQGGSQQAFADLVARHADWVYAAAKRQVGGDAHLAEDVAQATFLVLARRAGELREGTVVSAWLLGVLRYTSANARRAAARRRRHETRAAAMVDPHAAVSADAMAGEWDDVAPRLEGLVARLASADRDAVLLRFYEQKNYPEIAAALGTTAEAARKRVDRAVERLGALLSRNKGTTLSVGALAALLLRGTVVEAAPAGFALRTTSIAREANGATPAEMLAHRAMRDMALPRLLRTTLIAAAIVLLLILGSTAFKALRDPPSAVSLIRSTPPPSSPSPASPADPGAAPVPPIAATPSSTPFTIAPGWPHVLPGTVTGSVALADVDSDGVLEIIVPCRRRNAVEPLAHPDPSYAAQVYALRLDGSVLPGWPVQIVEAVATPNATQGVRWFSSPSVYPAGGGRDGIALVAPFRRGLRLIENGVVRQFPRGQAGVYQSVNVPVADLRGDGRWGAFTASLVIGVDGNELPGWPKSKLFHNGVAPCIGDADGDGSPELFHTFAVSFDSAVGTIGGFDADARPVPGWPRSFRCPIMWPPVMGDIAGDGRAEVVAAYSSDVFAWSFDAQPLIDTPDGDDPPGLFRRFINAWQSAPALADLTGDGKAEIIVIDERTGAIRAWSGDGQGVGENDGVLARLPGPARGVSVADLGGDGVMDLFAGTCWIRYTRGQPPVIVNLLSEPPADPYWTQPTICDIDRDGLADVIFGLSDGRVFVLRTGMAYAPRWMEWPTAAGNFQRTGEWKPPARRGDDERTPQPTPKG